MKFTFATLVLLSAPALADTARELDAHEHGVGELNIAIDGTTVAMEFHAPGADMVGFEYAAATAEDRAAVDAAVATLAKPLDLFVLPPAAACSVANASVMLEVEADHDDHDHGDHAEDDDHDDHDDHDHDEHAEDGDHDHDEAEVAHNEFRAEYTLTCGVPDALTEISFAYFGVFENARELEVQIVTTAGARAFEVERAEPFLDLRGMF